MPGCTIHVAATYGALQDVLGFLCRLVLGCFLDVHACVDALAANNRMIQGHRENLVIWPNNRMIQGHRENLVIWHTLVIKLIIFCRNHV